jgi:hypothetical protein
LKRWALLMGVMYKAEEAKRAARNAGHLRFRYLPTDWNIITIHWDSSQPRFG